MNCPKCGMTLPDDSEFCQYCGERIEPLNAISDIPTENIEKKCPKCGMALPDDSDFCQFCGEKIADHPVVELEQPASAVGKPSSLSEQPTRIPDPQTDESVAPIFNMLANNMLDNILANRKLTKKHTSDSDYGLVPEKPIFTFMVDGAKSYLNGLVSEKNEELTWVRKGSMQVRGIAGPVDIYVSQKKNGAEYKTLYVSIYAEANSQSIPRGFIRKDSGPKASHFTRTTTPGSISNTEQKKSPLRIVLIVIAAVGILLLSALNVFQYVINKKDQERISIAEQANKELTEKLAKQDENNRELNSSIASKDATIADKDKKILSQEKTISAQNSKISSYETKAYNYSTICDALKSGNIGYAARNFNCSQSIILVKKGETKKITLAANWDNGGTVSCSYSSNAASVDFDQDNWTYSTKLSITGFYSGVNVVTFSNDVDSNTFKIIIIVE